MVFEQIIDATLVRRRERDQGVMSLFGDLGGDSAERRSTSASPIPELEFDKSERLRFEKEMLGLYVSDHPLLGVEAALRRKVDCTHRRARRARGRRDAAPSAASITNLPASSPRRATRWRSSCSRTSTATIEVTVFPRTLMEHGHKLADDADRHGEGPARQARRGPRRVHGPRHQRPRGPRHRVGAAAAPRCRRRRSTS